MSPGRRRKPGPKKPRKVCSTRQARWAWALFPLPPNPHAKRLVPAGTCGQEKTCSLDNGAKTLTSPSDIHPRMTTEEAFRVIARDCIEQFGDNLPSLRQNWDTEALHQARVSLRRLVAAMTLFKKMVEDKRYERLGERVKGL